MSISDEIRLSSINVKKVKRATMQTSRELMPGMGQLLHPNMAEYYRQQITALAEALNAEENRAEAADLIRSLVDRIELTPNADNKLEIDLFGDLAGILSLAANKNRPLDESDPSVQQVKMHLT